MQLWTLSSVCCTVLSEHCRTLTPPTPSAAVRRLKGKFKYNGVQFVINKACMLNHYLARSLSTTIIIIICSYPKLRVPSKTDCLDFYFVCPGFGHTAGDFLATYTLLFFFPLLSQRWLWQQLLPQRSHWSETHQHWARRQLAILHLPAPDK